MRDRALLEVLAEYDAVRLALNLVAREATAGRAGTNLRDLGLARGRLGGTYLIRLLAVFEERLARLGGDPTLALSRRISFWRDAADFGSDEGFALLNRVESYRVGRNGICHRPESANWTEASLDEVVRDLRRFLSRCSRYDR